MKRIVPVVLAVLVLALGLAGCSKYVTHYSAIGHATTNDSDSASMSFMEFDGTEVFKLKCSGDQAAIRYSGQLKTGALSVYYDCGGEKQELFSLRSGDDVHGTGGELPKNTVYIIVETSEKCTNGALSFEVAYD